jgi:hypothetical protein
VKFSLRKQEKEIRPGKESRKINAGKTKETSLKEGKKLQK